MSLYSLGLCQAAEMIANGNITSHKLAEDCLERIESFESEIHAWQWHDPDYVRLQAQRLDDERRGEGKHLDACTVCRLESRTLLTRQAFQLSMDLSCLGGVCLERTRSSLINCSVKAQSSWVRPLPLRSQLECLE